MKRLAIVALAALLATSAHATIIMYVQNQNGGLIEFSDMACSKLDGIPRLKSMDGYAATIVDSTGVASMIGCYTYSEPSLNVTWDDGSQRYYQASMVTLTAAGKKLFEAAKKASY